MDLPPFLEELVRKGVEITIGYNSSYGLYFDLGTRTKSKVHLVFNGVDIDTPIYIAYMRYGETEEIWEISDIYSAVKHSMHGRDYIDGAWADILVENGYLQRIVTKTVTYK